MRCASLAPSHPAAFGDRAELLAILRRLGFDVVEETAAVLPGLIRERLRLLELSRSPLISTSCPRVVSLVEEQYSDLARYLAPLVSPMTAHARWLKERYGPCRVTFVGPCQAKKLEASRPEVSGSVDQVLTFAELARLSGGRRSKAAPFFSPAPVAVRLSVLSWEAAGEEAVRRALAAIQGRPGPARFLELLMCEGGCLGGPGMPRRVSLEEGCARVVSYADREEAAAETEIPRELYYQPGATVRRRSRSEEA